MRAQGAQHPFNTIELSRHNARPSRTNVLETFRHASVEMKRRLRCGERRDRRGLAERRGTRVNSRCYAFPVTDSLPTTHSVLTFARASMLPKTRAGRRSPATLWTERPRPAILTEEHRTTLGGTRCRACKR